MTTIAEQTHVMIAAATTVPGRFGPTVSSASGTTQPGGYSTGASGSPREFSDMAGILPGGQPSWTGIRTPRSAATSAARS